MGQAAIATQSRPPPPPQLLSLGFVRLALPPIILGTQPLIRIGCVSTFPLAGIKGQVRSIGVLRHRRMVGRLVDHLSQAVKS